MGRTEGENQTNTNLEGKNMKTLLSISALFVAFSAWADPRYVTLTAQFPSNAPTVTSFTLGANEVAELASFPDEINRSWTVIFIKPGGDSAIDYQVNSVDQVAWNISRPLVVAGPVTIGIRFDPVEVGNNDGRAQALCTFRVLPGSTSPQGTAVVAPGPGQTPVSLECSTDLVSWLAATNGVYGPLPEAKFFRIRLN